MSEPQNSEQNNYSKNYKQTKNTTVTNGCAGRMYTHHVFLNKVLIYAKLGLPTKNHYDVFLYTGKLTDRYKRKTTTICGRIATIMIPEKINDPTDIAVILGGVSVLNSRLNK